jgi:hypothetical protein
MDATDQFFSGMRFTPQMRLAVRQPDKNSTTE